MGTEKQTNVHLSVVTRPRRATSSDSADGDRILIVWQEAFIKKILGISLVFGVFAVIPSVYLSFYEKRYLIGVIDIVIFFLGCLLYSKDSLGYRLRATIMNWAVFFIGLLLLVTLGPFGGGPVWLFAFPVITGVLLGKRSAYLALFVNTVVLVGIGVFLEFGFLSWQLEADNPIQKWVVIVVNFILLNILTTISVVSILQALKSAIGKQRELMDSIKDKADEVESVNRQLLEEIDERRRSEKALAKSEEGYRLLADNTLDVIWTADMQGKFTYINPACENLTGWKPEEVVGSCIDHYFAPETLQLFRSQIGKALKGTTSINFGNAEIAVLDRNGIAVPVEVTGKILRDDRGKPIGLQGTTRDIRERRQAQVETEKLQVQLQQAQKMESIGRLAGGVAHDFNNLLTGITGNVSLALMDLPRGDPQRETFKEIEKAADSAAALTRQLLVFSRKQIISPKVLNLNKVIDHSFKMLRRLIGEDVDLIYHPCRDLRRTKVDPGQVEQILINLAVNARDAMPDGGRLTLQTRNVTCDEDYCKSHAYVVPGDYVVMTVSDDGIGMDETIRTHIFEPFFTTKAIDKGTGLGLATVYGAVKQNGGSIEVHSEPGGGSTFEVFFPAVEAETDMFTQTADMDDLPRGTETVLVVEDEKRVRSIAVKILTRQGYTVFQTDGGPQALVMSNEIVPNLSLLMTDVVMPNMNGRELAERLRATRRDLKVLYTSGYTDDIIAHHGVLDKDVNFIGKPYTPQMLARKVRDVLDS